MNDEASKIYGYTFISKANSKFFQYKFTFSRASPIGSRFFEGLPLYFYMSSKKAIRSYLMILKCSLAIWQLRSLTVEISDVPCTGKVVSLSPDPV